MHRTLFLTRPEPGLSATVELMQQTGLHAVAFPILRIQPVEWECPDPDGVDALLIGSANAIRDGGPALDRLKSKPVYAVGMTTAKAAQDAGFEIASVGTGGLQNVLDTVPAPKRLLRIAGADHVPLTAPDGVNVQTVIAYESVRVELPEPLLALDGLDLLVLLYSASAAEHFAQEAERFELDKSRIELALLGPRMVEAAGDGWREIYVSPQPNDAAMLEMVKNLCI